MIAFINGLSETAASGLYHTGKLLPFVAQDLFHELLGSAKLERFDGELPREPSNDLLLIALCKNRFALANESTSPLLVFQQPFGFQFRVGFDDRGGIDRKALRQLTDRRQLCSGLKRSGSDIILHLVHYLPVNGKARVGIDLEMQFHFDAGCTISTEHCGVNALFVKIEKPNSPFSGIPSEGGFLHVIATIYLIL